MENTPRLAAFFDVDRTLVGPPSMEKAFARYLIRVGYLGPGELGRYLVYLARNLDRLGAGLVRENKYHFKDKDAAELRGLAQECYEREIRPLVRPAGRRAVEAHQRRGHLVVLLTGSLQPLADLLARDLGVGLCLAARLKQERGVLAGTLGNTRPYGAEKARLARALAHERGLDLGGSWAYGDHHSDLAVLMAVGNPVAVNPDARLRLHARRRGWPILRF
ncbi:MAG: HAD family hydrolase [Thermodesulfobacteriota bacterium]